MLITPCSGNYPMMQLFVCSVRARSGNEILADVHILQPAKKFVTIQNTVKLFLSSHGNDMANLKNMVAFSNIFFFGKQTVNDYEVIQYSSNIVKIVFEIEICVIFAAIFNGIFVYNDLVLCKDSNDDLRATLILWNHASKFKIKVFFQRLSTCLSLLKVHNKRHDYF